MSHKNTEKVDWKNIELADTWPDKLIFKRPGDLRLFIRKVRGKQIEKVVLPEQLPLNIKIPKYVSQEFHNLPNGNYSKRISRGYITGFDKSMFGEMTKARQKVAKDLSSCNRVLDIGCAGGHTANAVKAAGAKEVFGLDPSPYLLQHAATEYPDINFIQGLAEDTGFADQSIDGISACFVFHEIPPKYSSLALKEFHRILRPAGIVSIAEPSPEQLYWSYWKMFKAFGFKGVYFRFLAKKVFEPFVDAWHKQDYQQWAKQGGFELIEDKTNMPVKFLTLQKR